MELLADRDPEEAGRSPRPLASFVATYPVSVHLSGPEYYSATRAQGSSP